MRRRVLFSLSILFAVASREAFPQDVVSASSGVLQYFEGAVSLDNMPIEHKAAVFPSLKNGSILATSKGRAELLLTPAVYLRMDEHSSLRMTSNSLTDSRIEVADGTAMLDNLNASSTDAVVLICRGSEVRFPKPGVYRIDADLGELQVYAGEAKVTHHGATSSVDSSHIYYFALELMTNRFGDVIPDEFYDWAHNRSDTITDQNQRAAADQADAQDPDPTVGAGTFLGGGPPFSPSSGYGTPPTSPSAYPAYSSTYAYTPYLYAAQTPFFGFTPFPVVVAAPPPLRRPHPISRWPSSTSTAGMSVFTHSPASTTLGGYYHPGASSIARPTTTTSVPRVTTYPFVAPHVTAVPHVGAVGHR